MMSVFTALRWILLSALIVLLAGPAAYVGLTRHAVVEVDGMSMSPTYVLGDVVTIRPPTPADLVPGAVVTVEDQDGDKYTHRIIEVTDAGLILQGDANAEADPAPVAPSAVVGVVDHHLAGGWATVAMQLQAWPLRVCLLVMILGLVFLPMALQPSSAPSGRRSDGVRRVRPRPAPLAQPVDGPEPPEVLHVVDSVRSAVTRVLLASDRRLAGTYTVTTAEGRDGFPQLRLVIDIAEKEPSDLTGPVPIVEQGRIMPSTVHEPAMAPRGAVTAVRPARAVVAAPAPAVTSDYPTRRSQREAAAPQRGRRRAG